MLAESVHLEGVAGWADLVTVLAGSTANVDMFGLNVIHQILLVLCNVVTTPTAPPSSSFLHQTVNLSFNYFRQKN